MQRDVDPVVTHNYTRNGRVSTAYLSGSPTQVGLLPQDFSLFSFPFFISILMLFIIILWKYDTYHIPHPSEHMVWNYSIAAI